MARIIVNLRILAFYISQNILKQCATLHLLVPLQRSRLWRSLCLPRVAIRRVGYSYTHLSVYLSIYLSIYLSSIYLFQCGCSHWWLGELEFSSVNTLWTSLYFSTLHINLLALMQWLNYSARGDGSLQARGLKGRSSNPKGRENRWCSWPLTRGFRAFKAFCWAFIAFK